MRLQKTLKQLITCASLTTLSTLGFASTNFASTWQDTLEEAKGQSVYMNAWGGSESVNDYLDWASQEVKEKYGLTLHHVKVDDISSVISRILAEKSAGRTNKGSVDIVWINGENFRAMKDNGLLHGPFVNALPNWRHIDTKDKPTTVVDFGEPTDGLEAPWGMAQLVFMNDTEVVPQPPKSMQELLSFSQKNPGLFTYPAPPDFIGTTFLKQALLELAADPARLQKPVNDKDFKRITQPLWSFLDQLHPQLWRSGRTFPTSATAMIPLLDDGELAMSLTFNPSEASTAINNGRLPDSVRTYVHNNGTIGNTHFLAIPFNSSANAGAKVVINFLMSPEAQLRKSDPQKWGDPTVLSIDSLNSEDKSAFKAQKLGIATLRPEQLGSPLPEPHPSWVNALEQAWQERYR
ncbi:ABC transporter substrate-binding protein [Parendozoicomonas sp. Alg238-R29]|uniref:ABC transporter substrate-binding protein n=1 Tax=Parendozoicomonas sp. Alg238-R29 TaxID=2993446 RepID=UPI00248DD3B0|nr:ABC transporter substrate-binding protein [Parendozoicomonas sp. Alg238-R29]